MTQWCRGLPSPLHMPALKPPKFVSADRCLQRRDAVESQRGIRQDDNQCAIGAEGHVARRLQRFAVEQLTRDHIEYPQRPGHRFVGNRTIQHR